jgi:hypothetical protein
MFGIGPAFGAEIRDRHLILVQLLLAIGFLDLPLDRQAVAVPARNVRRVLAEQDWVRTTMSFSTLFIAWPI